MIIYVKNVEISKNVEIKETLEALEFRHRLSLILIDFRTKQIFESMQQQMAINRPQCINSFPLGSCACRDLHRLQVLQQDESEVEFTKNVITE